MKVTLLFFLFFSFNCIAQGHAKTNTRVFATIIKAGDSITPQETPKTIKIGMTYQELHQDFEDPIETTLLPDHKLKLTYDDYVVYLEKDIVVIIRKTPKL